jgi:DNA-binding NarL/FixJ family response regulator
MTTTHHPLSRELSKANPDTSAIRVAVLDDHPAIQVGLEAILTSAPDLQFVGAVAGEEDLWPLLARHQPAVLVLDLHHPGRDGLALCVEVKHRDAAPALVLYSAAPNSAVEIAARIAGADRVLSKTSSAATLLEAVRFSASSPRDPPELSPQLIARAARRLDPADHAIFAMRLAGNTPAEIADTLSQPLPVIYRHVARIANQLAP